MSGARGGPSGSAAPEVTVVVATKDRPALLERTLRTILAQRDVTLEVVVVDDGSTDPAVVTQVAARLHEDITVLRNDAPTGVAAARNLGIAHARAPWVATTDDDDLWVPDKLRRQLDAAAAEDAPWAFGAAVHFLPGPRVWHVSRPPPVERLVRRLPHDNLVPAGSSNVVALREAYTSIGGFDEALPQLADWDAWLKLLRLGVPAVVDVPVVAYRLHPDNMVLRSTDGLLDEVDVIESRTGDLRGEGDLDRAPVHRWIATMLMRAGRRSEARRHYLAAARTGDRRSWARVARTYVPLDDIRSRYLRRPPPPVDPEFERWLADLEPAAVRP